MTKTVIKNATRKLRILSSGALCALAITLSVGCAEEDVVVEACERFNQCNVLEGQSVGECVESVERNLIVFTPTERGDWERVMDGCLGFAGCETFVDCVIDNEL